uniref:Uncharacterized protein n=1 Tax=Monodon monoceros TaxID=40151 RepID=A0A8C6F0J7_MONMO
MEPSGAAAVAVGLWVLVTVGVAADPEVVEPPRRFLSHYRSLDPRALLAIKALRDRYVSDAQTGGARAGARPRLTPAGCPQSRALLRQVARGLADAQDVLSSLPSPELFPGVGPTLELLAAAGRDVAACVSAPRPGRAPFPAPPVRLLPGLQDSPRCHEATVIFNLLRLLAWDLRLVAHSGPCL